MRPEILFPVFAAVTTLPGIGPRNAKLVEKLAGGRVADLYWHLPSGLIDRRFAPKIAEAVEGRIATITVHVDAHAKPRTPRLPYKVLCSDTTGEMTLVFFHGREDWLLRTLPVNATRVVSGRVEIYNGVVQMTHPDRIVTPEEAATLQTVEPVYPLTAGLPPRILSKAIAAAVERAPNLPEWQDAAFHSARGWTTWREALHSVHHPMSDADLLPETPARSRLAYDELLANQIALALVRAHTRRLPGRKLEGDGRIRRKLLAALPYTLTASQSEAVAEIAEDLGSGTRMLRLLQGDVGSGKTVVALLAMAIAAEEGAQAALMAPTEVLARQHMESLLPLAEAAGLRLALLTGRDKGRARAEILTRIAGGEVDIAIGTHALFQDDVAFRDLALVVIDEQHRFGVDQRLTIAAKGDKDRGGVAVLVMTATPIPRTLTLTAYGDMDVSRLTEKPPGRQPIDTRILPLERMDEVLSAVGRKITAGGRVFWICPLVEESEDLDIAAAQERHRSLGELFGGTVALVHGRMKGSEKDRAMEDFAAGRVRILVATTVVEVGINVPEATVMVVEHAERFGLAQLHQLRGRVGRGSERSTCLLLYGSPLGETAKARLKILRETDDGFRIAEEDLRLRGAGELLGTRQSGLPTFRVADLAHHAELLAAARDDARLMLDRDPGLESARGQTLRILLYLFERDAAVRYLRSG
ncbi:MAG TPA: ATP-dependent DNA helicase RecG [Candidatus Cybelea sp.]|nr:ATP-dependent DNA helicase RecG [Candidatus Cybelea sp.]